MAVLRQYSRSNQRGLGLFIRLYVQQPEREKYEFEILMQSIFRAID